MEYALYKGEEILAIGTIKEIAEKMDVKESTVKFYGTQSHINRSSEDARRLVQIGGEDEY